MPLTTPHPYPAYKPSGVPWLGNVPQHWEMRRLKGVVANVVELAREKSGDDIYLALEHVESWTGRLSASLNGAAFDSQVKRFRRGDVLFGKLRPYLAKVTRPESQGVCVGEFLVLRPSDSGLLPRYLEQHLRCKPIIDAIDASTFGARMPRADWQFIGNMSLPLPPLPEQRAIVRYLGNVDERIQRYVDAKEKLVGLLEEEKQAVVNRAVTRGLDPNVRLKSSGVDWLGDVPEHWEVRRLGQIATSFRTGPFGSMLHQSDYIENGIPVVNPVHMRGGEIVEDSKSTVPEAIAEKLSNYRLGRHDLVFSRRGELGRCVLVRDRETNWLCGTGSIRVRVSYCGIRPEFLIQSLHGQWVGEHLSIFSVGTTMANLNTGILKGVPVPLPPVDEQGDILEDIRKKGQGIDAAITRAQLQTELLQEYRTRLISDVVTGKVDVREAASQLPEHTMTESG